jgi:hypothetical protein
MDSWLEPDVYFDALCRSYTSCTRQTIGHMVQHAVMIKTSLLNQMVHKQWWALHRGQIKRRTSGDELFITIGSYTSMTVKITSSPPKQTTRQRLWALCHYLIIFLTNGDVQLHHHWIVCQIGDNVLLVTTRLNAGPVVMMEMTSLWWWSLSPPIPNR